MSVASISRLSSWVRHGLFVGMFALGLACQPAPTPPPPAKAQPQTPPPPKQEPIAPPPAPAPAPEPPPPVVPEGCKVVIDGQAEGDGVKRALVNTSSGGIYDTTVVDGRVIEFECPPAAERQGANIIAEKDNAELVHWAGVELSPEGGDKPLAAADAKPDLPEGLDEETLARLRAKWPDLSKWDEQPAAEPAPEGGSGTPTPADEKIPVSFSAHKLYWAELKAEHTGTKKAIRAVLDPKASKSLAPGIYKLSVKLEDGGAWVDAGTLEIEAGKSKYSVQMLDNPPRAQVSGS